MGAEDLCKEAPLYEALSADARSLQLADESVDVIITSPPYWRKRKYGVPGELGQEATPEAYVDAIMACFNLWKRQLRKSGSVFLNVGDTYWRNSLVGIPFLIERAAISDGWTLRNRIVWAKTAGIPEPSQRRLANRHEYVLHFVKHRDAYYYDMHGYAMVYGNGTNPGDIWRLDLERGLHQHLAPFPEALVERCITLACPVAVCTTCGQPRRRIVERTMELNMERPQARRALEIYERSGLTEEHIRAVQATGISDAGKALQIQNGTGRNAPRVKQLAAEAKRVLGGYFREFTFAKKRSIGWTVCDCGGKLAPGLVLDPFAGTGTTGRVSRRLGVSCIQADLAF